MPKSSWASPKAMRGKCERRRGSANADGAGAEVFAGDEHSRERLFDPMAAISRRWLGGRIYNNTRTREPLRRKCVKPADLTTHSSPKTCSRPRTAPRPARAFSHSLPEHFLTPSPPRRTPAGCAMHSSPTSQHIPRRRSAPTPAQRRALPLPSCHIPAAQTHARRPHHPFLAEACHPSPHSDTPLPLRSTSGTKKTAPHSACAMPNVSVDRRCGRSFGLVSRALFAAVAGRWRVGVGLRPQPWALRSRRCGRVLRA